MAEALKTMSKGVNEFTKSSSKAIDGLTSKIDTMSGTVTIMQEQLKKQAENLEPSWVKSAKRPSQAPQPRKL